MIAEYREHLDKGELLYNPVLAGYKHPNTIDWTPFPDQRVHRELRYHGTDRRSCSAVQATDDFPGRLHAAFTRQEDRRGSRCDGRGQTAGRLGHGRESGLCFVAGFWLRGAHLR
jgi:hypothetical protein